MNRLTRGRIALLIACWGVLARSPEARSAQSADVPLDAAAIGVGLGRTFTTWDTSGVIVVPLSFSFDEDRYEIAAFRLTGVQHDIPWPTVTRVLAEPYWAATASRRVTVLRGTYWRAFLGLGAAYKTSADYISGSHWDFTESLGTRFALPSKPVAFEFVVRHWSNAGLRRPNYGQNLVTLSFLWHPWNHSTDGQPSADSAVRE